MIYNIYIMMDIHGGRSRDGIGGVVIEPQMENAGEHTISRYGALHDVTENRGALILLETALDWIIKYGSKENKAEKVCIFTDTKYVEAAFRLEWTALWTENDYKTAKGTDIANKTEWEKVLEALKGLEVETHLNEEHSYRKIMGFEIQKRSKHV